MKDFEEIPSKRQKTKLILGVGVNDVNYKVQYSQGSLKFQCPYYTVWKDMLKRCYDSAFYTKRPTYTQCTVDASWLVFSVFKAWMQEQDWKGKQLDKDIIFKRNKIYSPKTCIFVSHEINNILCIKKQLSNTLLGVTHHKQNNTYRAVCSVKGKSVSLGYYPTEEEAHSVYISFKQKHIIDLANQQTDKHLKEYLLLRAFDFML